LEKVYFRGGGGKGEKEKRGKGEEGKRRVGEWENRR